MSQTPVRASPPETSKKSSSPVSPRKNEAGAWASASPNVSLNNTTKASYSSAIPISAQAPPSASPSENDRHGPHIIALIRKPPPPSRHSRPLIAYAPARPLLKKLPPPPH